MSVAHRFIGPVCTGLIALGATAIIGCGGDSESGGANRSGSGATGSGATGAGTDAGTGGSGVGGAGGTAGAISAGMGGSENGGAGGSSAGSGAAGATGCEGTRVTTPKRLVRLTDNQLVTGYTALFGDAAGAMFAEEDILPATQRSFPPLATVGTSIDQGAWDLRRRAAERARTHVTTNVDTLTPCGATPTDAECGLNAVLAFAEKAYRRPLDPAETTSYQALWSEVTTTPGVSLATAIGYGYSAVLVAPGFLFRTETGGDFTTEGNISQYELASELSHFLTDGPPDAELLAAAAASQLDDAAVRTHARRILEGQNARDNLEAALVSYFRLSQVPSVIINADVIPGFTLTPGVKNSMYREGEEFFRNTLWQGTVGDLVTSRRTWINSALAPLYGVTVPSNDVNVFSQVTLPADRAGLLTLSPFLTSMSRPHGVGVVPRGLALNGLVCFELPPFPEGDTGIEDTIIDQTGWNERQKADYRMQAPVCGGCHGLFDPMALALENYDAIGRYRTEDPTGTPIDLAWTTSAMPPMFDYDQDGDGEPEPVLVSSAVTLAQALLRDQAAWGGTNAFTRCMAMSFINYALADESQGSARAFNGDPASSCAVRAVTDRFVTATDKSFSSLLAEIAASDTLRIRKPGM